VPRNILWAKISALEYHQERIKEKRNVPLETFLKGVRIYAGGSPEGRCRMRLSPYPAYIETARTMSKGSESA
jgi:hypothetical protein